MLRDLKHLSGIEEQLNRKDLESWERKEWEKLKTVGTHDLKAVIDHIKIKGHIFSFGKYQFSCINK